MKGLALGWGGILAICLVATLVVYYMVGAEDMTRDMLVWESQVISTGNDVQLYLKMIPETIETLAQYSAYKSGSQGGGFATWTASSPTRNQIESNLLQQIKLDLPQVIEDRTKTITFSDTDVSMTDISEAGFTLNHQRGMSIYDSKSQSVSNSEINLKKEIHSTYFKLVRIGMALASNEQYIISNSRFQDNGDSTFNVNGNNGLCNAITMKSTPTSDASYTYVNVENVAKVAISCGYEDVFGINSITNNDPNAVTTSMNNVLAYLNQDLSTKYGLVVVSGSSTIQGANRFTITLSAKIEDGNSDVYISPGHTDKLRLQFNLPQIDAVLKYHDVEITDISFSESTSPVTIYFTVKNNGNMGVSGIQYKVYLNNQDMFTETITNSIPAGLSSPPIAAGWQATQSGTIGIAIDTSNLLIETNENNNYRTASLVIPTT